MHICFSKIAIKFQRCAGGAIAEEAFTEERSISNRSCHWSSHMRRKGAAETSIYSRYHRSLYRGPLDWTSSAAEYGLRMGASSRHHSCYFIRRRLTSFKAGPRRALKEVMTRRVLSLKSLHAGWRYSAGALCSGSTYAANEKEALLISTIAIH
jgi:hypothetical protein